MAEGHSSLTSQLRPVLYGFAVALTLLGLAIATVETLYRKNILPELEKLSSTQDEHLETYLADIEFLEKSEIARLLSELTQGSRSKANPEAWPEIGPEDVPKDGPKDSLAAAERGAASSTPPPQGSIEAGPFLNAKIFWKNANSEFGRKEPLVAPASREFVMRYEDNWMKGRNFLERQRIKADVSIFDKLDDFKTWDLESESPLAPLIDDGGFVNPADLPVPDSLDLLTAIKVRLIKGSIDGEPLTALKSIRKFAMLLLTTENYQMVMTGLVALDLERRAYREYVERELIDRAAWSPIDTNTAARASRAFNATAGYLRASTSTPVFKKIFFSDIKPPGLCASANLQLSAELAYRNRLTGWWPFEISFREGFSNLDKAFESGKSVCRWKMLRAQSENGGFRGPAPNAPLILRDLPYFRTLFALRDWAAWPMHFDGYERR